MSVDHPSSRRFPGPWRVNDDAPGEFLEVCDDNGVRLALVPYRPDAASWRWSHGHLTPDEARRIARGIARLPDLLAQRRGFVPRAEAPRLNPKRPYHVALEDGALRARWFEIDEICRANSLPFNATGEVIQDRGAWRVFEFTFQLDAIQFYAAFGGRWLRGSEFIFPEVPEGLPPLRMPRARIR